MAAAISCDNALHEGAGNPLGTFALLKLPARQPGTYENVFVEFATLTSSGSHFGGGNSGVVHLTDVTPTTVIGDVSYSYQSSNGGMDSLHGNFEVAHCTNH